ncbi:uncharacterized protein LOC100519366 isoform X1 [Sus scrofa]|uniref:uncharacterized protein LOC100519366 isoform X1 n=1 Tax=Sus scrofa TaxID=9823 RepID=UPI000A2B4631|nr:uncharacterized protein LOC100519366 isoform X1 [Sus scrofa]
MRGGSDSREKHLSSSAQGRHSSGRRPCRLPPRGRPPDLAPLLRALLQVSGTRPPPWCSCWSDIPSQLDAEGECPGMFRGSYSVPGLTDPPLGGHCPAPEGHLQPRLKNGEEALRP